MESRDLYKVRRVGKNCEALIHAPADAAGWYRLIVETNGDFRYVKVNY